MIKQHTFAQKRTIRTGCTLFGVTAVLLCNSLNAEVEDELEELVVSAWRVPQELSRTTSSITAIDPKEMEKMGILDLKDALNRIPGVISTSTSAQTGGVGSIFIRGTTTSYSQLVVDGMSISDASTEMGNFLSGARVNGYNRIEVIRGPQAAIHGGESVGGVLWLETARGSGDTKNYLQTEIGSFGSYQVYGANSGEKDGLSWYLGGGIEHTDNDLSDESFDLFRTAMRLEWVQSDNLTIGMTYRGADSNFEYSSFGSPAIDRLDSNLVTAYANARNAPGWYSTYLFGFYQENYDNYTPGNFSTDVERFVLSQDHSFELTQSHTLLFGGFVEHNDYVNSFNTTSEEYRYGAHVGMKWEPTDQITTDVVVRWEDYVDYEDQFTWRMGGGWQALDKTKFVTGVGKAFKTPTYLDLYGGSIAIGNPNLDAEESLGWDLGIEQELTANHRVSVTYFENSIENQIVSTFSLITPPFNLPGSTQTRGLEFAANGKITEEIDYQVSWTWLMDSLQDQPENTATVSIQYRPIEKLLLGAGATYVDTRSYGGNPLDAYLLLRVHASYQLTENVALNARVENLADEEYELSNFFGDSVKGAGLGFYTGITATF